MGLFNKTKTVRKEYVSDENTKRVMNFLYEIDNPPDPNQRYNVQFGVEYGDGGGDTKTEYVFCERMPLWQIRNVCSMKDHEMEQWALRHGLTQVRFIHGQFYVIRKTPCD